MTELSAQGPRWDLSAEYPGPSSAAVQADLLALDELLAAMQGLNANLHGDAAISTAQRLFELSTQAEILLRNVSAFASCLLSVDSHDEAAQVLQGEELRQAPRNIV